MRRILAALCLGVLLTGVSVNLWAEETAHDDVVPLFGRGTSFQVTSTTDFVANLAGGLSRKSTVLENLDLIFNLDTAEAGLWEHGKFKFYGLVDGGGNISMLTGAMQVNSNIDAPTTAKLYEAYYEHEMLDGRLTVLAGLHNYNSEFDVAEFAGLFLNASFGIGQDVAQSGPSIFPTTSLALRFRGQLTDRIYALLGVYDGVPGDASNTSGTHIRLSRADGLYYAGEVGLHSTEAESAENLYKVGLGVWRRTTDFTDYSDENRPHNTGFYVTLDKSLFREEDTAQGLGAFFQFGYAPGDRNQTEEYYGAGLQYTGLVPDRDQDVTGIAFARAENSHDYQEVTPDSTAAETIVELTYRAPILSWLTLQPDIQYVINPGTSSDVDNALVVMLRVQASLSE